MILFNASDVADRCDSAFHAKICNAVLTIVICVVLVVFCSPSRGRASVVLVDAGKGRAVLITADDPCPISMLAAGELVTHVKKATGVNLSVISESQTEPAGMVSRVYIGSTLAAKDLGINAEALETDAFVLRTHDRDVFIVGKEDDSEYRDSGLNGTLYGIYEVLHRYAGVRWVWPGELGTYIPRRDRISIETHLDETQSVRFRNRNFRAHHVRRAAESAAKGKAPQPEGLNFSPSVVRDYWADKQVFMRRHRLGHSGPRYSPGHRFSGWWQKYGEEHPEWFMMHKNGERGYVHHVPFYGASSTPSHVGMCVSNPELHRFLVEEVWDGGDQLSLGEVDRRGFCQCENCLAWDAPQPNPEEYPASVRADYTPQAVSDRYAKFWKTILDKAVERNPDVTVTTFLYWNYFPAPSQEIELGSQVYGEYVPWTGPAAWVPMSESLDAWVRKQWLGWHRTGMRLAYRPNMLHGGYVMPYFSTRQAGDFFKFAYQHGMEALDFDTLFGHWATKGPMLYIYLRLAWEPEAEIDALRQEYFSVFGPAAGPVEEYFDYWEDHAHVIAERAIQRAHETPLDEFCPHTGFFASLFPARSMRSHIEYPPEVFLRAETLLSKAAEVAATDAQREFAERVNFLEIGLQHAKLCAELWAVYDVDNAVPASEDPERVEKVQQKIRELIEFRQRYEHTYFADLIHAAQWEPLSDFDGIIH